jgi:hypothetical protein
MAVNAIYDAVLAQRQSVGRAVNCNNRFAVVCLQRVSEPSANYSCADLHKRFHLGRVDAREGLAYVDTLIRAVYARPFCALEKALSH